MLFSIRCIHHTKWIWRWERRIIAEKIYVLSSLTIVCEIVIRLFDVKNGFSIYKWNISFKYRQPQILDWFLFRLVTSVKGKEKKKEISRLVAYICLIVILKLRRRHSGTFHYLWMHSNIIRKRRKKPLVSLVLATLHDTYLSRENMLFCFTVSFCIYAKKVFRNKHNDNGFGPQRRRTPSCVSSIFNHSSFQFPFSLSV